VDESTTEPELHGWINRGFGVDTRVSNLAFVEERDGAWGWPVRSDLTTCGGEWRARGGVIGSNCMRGEWRARGGGVVGRVRVWLG
jgi:hypothetical protein